MSNIVTTFDDRGQVLDIDDLPTLEQIGRLWCGARKREIVMLAGGKCR